MRENKLFCIFCIILVLCGFSSVSCRQSAQPETASNNTVKSVEEMTTECRKHCQKSSESGDNLRTMMQQARQSKDPAKMSEALEKMENNLDEIRGHLSGCMTMMEITSTRILRNSGGSAPAQNR